VERPVARLHSPDRSPRGTDGHGRGGHYAKGWVAAALDRVSHAISLGADLRGLLGISPPTQKAVRIAAGAPRCSGRARHPDCLTINCPCGFAADYGRAFPTEQVQSQGIPRHRSGAGNSRAFGDRLLCEFCATLEVVDCGGRRRLPPVSVVGASGVESLCPVAARGISRRRCPGADPSSRRTGTQTGR
jgi:hypothetical protein